MEIFKIIRGFCLNPSRSKGGGQADPKGFSSITFDKDKILKQNSG